MFVLDNVFKDHARAEEACEAEAEWLEYTVRVRMGPYRTSFLGKAIE